MKILITDLAYFYHNYGAQGIILPFIDKLSKHIDAKITVTISNPEFKKFDREFATQNNFELFVKPRINFGTIFNMKSIKQHIEYWKLVKKNDIVIDLSGIEFIGNLPTITKWKDLINTIYTQYITKKYNKKYYKYTKSYGPFLNNLYTKIVRNWFNKLPFIFVRGDDNLRDVNKLKLHPAVYSFPDISLALVPESRDWAEKYLKSIVQNDDKILGISPSVVIRNITNFSGKTSGEEHVTLCKQLIIKYTDLGKKVLLIPHSIGNGINISNCDLALSRKIFAELKGIKNLYILDDPTLNYRQTRAIIGLLDFYITSRYHSVASALTMKIPVVSLSWHIKYKDIMGLYMDDFLTVNCRKVSVAEALEQIDNYYQNRNWYDKKQMHVSQIELEKKIDESMSLIIKDIKE